MEKSPPDSSLPPSSSLSFVRILTPLSPYTLFLSVALSLGLYSPRSKPLISSTLNSFPENPKFIQRYVSAPISLHLSMFCKGTSVTIITFCLNPPQSITSFKQPSIIGDNHPIFSENMKAVFSFQDSIL